MGGDGMRALVDGRGLTLRSILTFATALKKDPVEEKRERPMMPKDTEAEVRLHKCTSGMYWKHGYGIDVVGARLE